MKAITSFIMILLVTSLGNYSLAQDSKTEKQAIKEAQREARKMEKASRKNEEEEQLKKNMALIESLIKDSTFVVETHTLYDRYGVSYPVSSNTNFVSLQGNQFTMQIASNSGFGANGLGGITLDGRVIKYDVRKKEKNGMVNIIMQVNALGIGPTTVYLFVNRSGNAKVDVRGSFRQRISFAGQFVPLENSTVYKGMVTY